MGQPRAPHRLGIFLAHPGLVADRERDCDSARRPGQRRADVRAEPVAQRIEPAPARRFDQFDRADRPARPAALGEPGVAREIVPAGERHRRRWLDPRLDPDPRAAREPVGGILGRKRHTQPRHRARRCQREPDIVLGDELLDLFDPRVEHGDGRAIESRRGDPFAASPDEPAPRAERKPPDQQHAPEPPPPPRQPAERNAQRQDDERLPLRGPGQPQPCRDAAGEGGDEPQGQLPALGFQKGFDAGFGALGKTRGKAWRRMFQRGILYVRGAHPCHLGWQNKGKRVSAQATI